MNRALLPACALAFATAALGGVSARDAEHRLLNEISIGGEGGWDYIIGDPSAHRLYVSHATQIVVADMTSGDIVGRIPDLPGVHGIALAPRLGRGFTSNGRANSSTIVDLKTLQPLGTVPTGANPDSIRYLEDRGEVWTFNHSDGSITAFTANDGKVVATILVGGALEEAVEDAAAERVYVNVEDKAVIGVVDTKQHALVATWPIPKCEEPTGLAFDEQNHLLLSACQGSMAVVDSRSGTVVTRFPIAEGVDGNGFDPITRMAFASSGRGVLTIAHQDSPRAFTVVQTLATRPSGRTMWLDPTSHRVYVPAGTQAPGANGRPSVVPGSLKVLVLGAGD